MDAIVAAPGDDAIRAVRKIVKAIDALPASYEQRRAVLELICTALNQACRRAGKQVLH